MPEFPEIGGTHGPVQGSWQGRCARHLTNSRSTRRGALPGPPAGEGPRPPGAHRRPGPWPDHVRACRGPGPSGGRGRLGAAQVSRHLGRHPAASSPSTRDGGEGMPARALARPGRRIRALAARLPPSSPLPPDCPSIISHGSVGFCDRAGGFISPQNFPVWGFFQLLPWGGWLPATSRPSWASGPRSGALAPSSLPLPVPLARRVTLEFAMAGSDDDA